MKRLSVVMMALLMIFYLYGKVDVVFFTFKMGSNSSIDTSGTQDVLSMYVNMNPNLENEIFTLNNLESHTFLFATIGTTEPWVNNDDLHSGNMVASVHFDNPQLTHTINGISTGLRSSFYFTQGWNVAWEGTKTIDLSDNWNFSIALSDASYCNWFWQGPSGSTNIYATVQLNAVDVNAVDVPEPTVILLFGIGLFTFAGFFRRWKFKNKDLKLLK